MRSLIFFLTICVTDVFSQISSVSHPSTYEGPQNQVVPSLIYPTERVNRIRSRVFRDASQGYRSIVDSPRLFRASGRFHKRVQSATTHDIQNVPLPQDSVQIVSYKYDAERHNEKKMNENDILSNEEAEDHAKGIERTTMAVKTRPSDTTTPASTTIAAFTTPSSVGLFSSTPMIEQNSINEAAPQFPQRPKTFFQTVTANGGQIPQLPPGIPQQPPAVFTPPPPPISPPTFTLPLPGQPQPQLPTQPFPAMVGIVPPHQATNPLTANPPDLTNAGLNLQPPNNAARPPQATNVDLNRPTDAVTGSSSHEQLGCGWDWLTNSCKDVFNLNWCGKCHDFGNIFLHDCKCVAPLIPLPTTPRPSVAPPPTPPRHPLLFWLI
ncbi:unnamed protein product [Caenorhabditis bovis]|uniref:ShKT domain-containing protein n=1 Tax=Caenorhabditis bovis TaxID=2654633 RepID=A0A8S1E7J5_9PELO|nr:unnamed protein product [Caenorhabditis bovis]